MDANWKSTIWRQFGAAIDMLGHAIDECPEALWRERLWDHSGDPPGVSDYWYLAFHAIFWLDSYLSGSKQGFAPPSPFTLSEFEAGAMPERTYTRDELRTYLNYSRAKCKTTIESLTDESAGRICKFGWGQVSFMELLLYNMRHVQEHGAQLNMLLGQRNISPMVGWVSKAEEGPRAA